MRRNASQLASTSFVGAKRSDGSGIRERAKTVSATTETGVDSKSSLKGVAVGLIKSNTLINALLSNARIARAAGGVPDLVPQTSAGGIGGARACASNGVKGLFVSTIVGADGSSLGARLTFTNG